MIVGIDIGATNTRVAVASNAGDIEASARAATMELAGAQRLVDWVDARLRELAPGQTATCIGVASPGPLDPRQGVVINPPNLVGWENVPLAEMLSEVVGCPAYLENDANLAALGEFHAGAGRGTTNMVYVTWS